MALLKIGLKLRHTACKHTRIFFIQSPPVLDNFNIDYVADAIFLAGIRNR